MTITPERSSVQPLFPDGSARLMLPYRTARVVLDLLKAQEVRAVASTGYFIATLQQGRPSDSDEARKMVQWRHLYFLLLRGPPQQADCIYARQGQWWPQEELQIISSS